MQLAQSAGCEPRIGRSRAAALRWCSRTCCRSAITPASAVASVGGAPGCSCASTALAAESVAARCAARRRQTVARLSWSSAALVASPACSNAARPSSKRWSAAPSWSGFGFGFGFGSGFGSGFGFGFGSGSGFGLS